MKEARVLPFKRDESQAPPSIEYALIAVVKLNNSQPVARRLEFAVNPQLFQTMGEFEFWLRDGAGDLCPCLRWRYTRIMVCYAPGDTYTMRQYAEKYGFSLEELQYPERRCSCMTCYDQGWYGGCPECGLY